MGKGKQQTVLSCFIITGGIKIFDCQKLPATLDSCLIILCLFQVLYKNYFDTREKRKEEIQAYFDSSFPKKGIKDLDTSEYPIRGPNL